MQTDTEREKHLVDTMTAKKVLTETLKDLSSVELEEFKSLIEYEKDFQSLSRSRLKSANKSDIVELLVETNSPECVELTKRVLKKMRRTDLEQSLSGISPGTKEKQWPPLIQRVEAMASVIELLLETLKDLAYWELKEFKDIVLREHRFYSRFSDISLMRPEIPDRQDIVFFMVQTYGQKSVEISRNILRKMNRIDLVQKLSDSSSGHRKRHSLDERLSTLIHKVATMVAVKELLSETLNGLSYEEKGKFQWLLQFTFFQRSFPLISQRQLQLLGVADQLVDLMIDVCGQQSVEVMKEVLMNMNRTDLVQRLPEISSGQDVSTVSSEKHSVDEHWPALIQKVNTMASVIELLLETLAALSDREFEEFKLVLLRQTDFTKRISYSLLMSLEITYMQDTVFLLVQTDAQQSVETAKEVLEKIKRTDLVQKLSDRSSAPKEKHSDELRPALIQGVAAMAVVKQLLLETLNDLNYEELVQFQWILDETVSQNNEIFRSPMRLIGEKAELVDLIVQSYGQKSLDLTREVVEKMNRIDLMQRLSEPGSGLKEQHNVGEHRPAVLKRVAVKQVLKDFSHEEFAKFKWLLQFTYFQKGLPHISCRRLDWANSAGALVDLMVENQQLMEVTKEVFMDMNRPDLVERLSETSSGLKEKHQSVLLQKEVIILETLEDLNHEELKRFKHVLKQTKIMKGLPRIPSHRLEATGRMDVAELMVETYGEQSVEVTTEVLKEMNRTDLVQRFSEINLRAKGPSGSLEPKACGSMMQVSSDWTKVDPEVNRTDEAPTYSLQSEAGNFECSVSGLRWMCKEKVSLKYQFCSSEDHMERIESIQYMPAGPLMDITVIAGKLDVVYLPHWICIDDNPTILDKFAVLHIDDCGVTVEKVSEVTSSHVKLCDPAFSLKLVLVKLGFSVEIKCKVFVYKTNKPFLKLHVYLIPPDPALIKELNKKKKSFGYEEIPMQHPKKPLKMNDWFILSAHLDGKEIASDELMLEYESIEPNFYQLFIKNPDTDFELKLKRKNEHQPVWSCGILKEEYQSTGPVQDKRLSALVQKDAAITEEEKRLLKMLKDLSSEQFKEFKWLLRDILPWDQLENSDRLDVVKMMWQTCTEESFEVTKNVFKEINRNDLAQMLSDTGSGSKAAGSSA